MLSLLLPSLSQFVRRPFVLLHAHIHTHICSITNKQLWWGTFRVAQCTPVPPRKSGAVQLSCSVEAIVVCHVSEIRRKEKRLPPPGGCYATKRPRTARCRSERVAHSGCSDTGSLRQTSARRSRTPPHRRPSSPHTPFGAKALSERAHIKYRQTSIIT